MRVMPVLRMHARGKLTDEQYRWLLNTLRLEETPRTEGPGASASIAHHAFDNGIGNHLIIDLGKVSEEGWLLALFYDKRGELPSDATVDEHRLLFRGVAEQLGLKIVSVSPAATADEVFVMPQPHGTMEIGDPISWDMPYDTLAEMWPHLGLSQDAPWEVKRVKLLEIMRAPIWAVAPRELRGEAEAFLQGR